MQSPIFFSFSFSDFTNDLSVLDVFSLIYGYLVFIYKEHCFRSIYSTWHALLQSSDFVSEQFYPYLSVLWVYAEMAILQQLSSVSVKDWSRNFAYEFHWEFFWCQISRYCWSWRDVHAGEYYFLCEGSARRLCVAGWRVLLALYWFPRDRLCLLYCSCCIHPWWWYMILLHPCRLHSDVACCFVLLFIALLVAKKWFLIFLNIRGRFLQVWLVCCPSTLLLVFLLHARWHIPVWRCSLWCVCVWSTLCLCF